LSDTSLAAMVDDLDRLGFDSLWLPEVLSGTTIDPLAGLSWAAGHNRRLKIGTTMLLPGRNLLRLAKQLATVDALSAGRLLITFVPGLAFGPEKAAIGLEPSQRGAAIDDAIPVLRQLWSGAEVTYHGPGGHIDGVVLSPLPVQQPLEMWLGGMAPASLRRCGRLADGWLPSMCTPDEAKAGRVVVVQAASEAERAISDEHFGVSIAYSRAPLTDSALASLRARRAGGDPASKVPIGLTALRRLVESFVEVGFSKFVVRPMTPPDDWHTELVDLAEAVGALQT
jgi:probable F420-dependent oxidoreductase